MRLDAAALRAQARVGLSPPLLASLVRVPVSDSTLRDLESARGSLALRLASTPEGERGRVVIELVCGEVAAVLGHSSAAAIDTERPFSELGFDSLAAVELRNRLGVVSGVRLPATLVFDYPTCTALGDFLLGEMRSEIGSSGGRGAEAPGARDATAPTPLVRQGVGQQSGQRLA